MKLFAIGNGSVSDYLRSNISSLKDKIASYTDEQIMNSDFDEWVEYLTKKYQVEPITFFVNATTRSLHETTIQQYNPWSRMGSAYGEPEYYNLDGYNIDFKIPFAGDSILLKCQPSTYTFTSYEIVDFQRSTESSYGYITIRLSYTNQEIKSFGEQLEEKIDTAFKNRFKNFEETSGYVNNEVRSYNEQLESTVRQLLNERKNKASDFFSISKALKIPLNLNSSAPNLTPIPLKKPHRANLNEPKQHAPEKQYYIDDADFENIVRIIHICGMALEESARTFNRFNEEELRDYIKGMLTSHYENAVTGETFRRVGKTDIQIQRDDKAAFIAECKVWHGIKLFSDAIDQLFCYATWKDTTKIKNCGAVLSNEVEYEPSVYIEATDSAKYPWLSFVVTGEQLTMTQVSFAIYALYLPTKDSQCTQAVDTIEQNQKYQNRLITLKQAQNPKIKNYIESINEILISGLEAWLNNNNTSSMYD